MDPEVVPSAAKSGDGRPLKVFLSYAHDDQGAARQIADGLSARGFSVWTDRQIAVGQSIASAIASNIEKSDAVVVMMSPSSAKSQRVSTEVAMAVANSLEGSAKRVLPVLVAGDSSEAVPPLLANHLYLDLRGKIDDARQLDRLAYVLLHERAPDTDYDAALRVTDLESRAFRRLAARQTVAVSVSEHAALRWILRAAVLVLISGLTIVGLVFAASGKDVAVWFATAGNVSALVAAIWGWRVTRLEAARASRRQHVVEAVQSTRDQTKSHFREFNR